MPVYFKIEGEILCETISGTPTPAEYRQAESLIVTDPEFKQGLSVLIDGRRCGTALYPELRGRSTFLTAGAPRISPTIAVVMPRAGDFPLGRRLASYAGFVDSILVLFTDLDQARTWLCAQRSEPESLTSFARRGSGMG
jgi:hypothetical protein